MSKSTFNASANRPSQNGPEYTKKKSFGYGYGYYFRPLQDYHDGQLSRLEVEFFEYLLGLNEYYLREGNIKFYHSYARIQEDIRIAKSTLKIMIEKFTKLGLLSTCLTTQYGRQVTTFDVNYLGIIRKRKVLFGKSDFQERDKVERIKNRCVALVKMYLERKRLLKPNRY